MVKKYLIAIFGLCLTLAIIFLVTFFNQQRYYAIQEKNRSNSFELLLNAKSETNRTCLKYASQSECFTSFVNSLEELNPRGVVKLTDINKKIVKVWDNEAHKDDRISVTKSKTFNEFDTKPTVTLLKLTRHQNLFKSSLNAMFFSPFDYAGYIKAKINGEPSPFGDMTPFEFGKYVAWGRFYPILPIWIIAILLFGYIISLTFKNISFNNSIKNLQSKISSKEIELERMYLDSELIKKSSDELHLEMARKLDLLNNEKNDYKLKADSNELALNQLSNDKSNLLIKIKDIESLNRNNISKSQQLLEDLNKQKDVYLKLNQTNTNLENDITTHVSDKELYKEQLVDAKTKLTELERNYAETKAKESSFTENLLHLQNELSDLNSQLTTSKNYQTSIANQLENKENELNDYLSFVSDLEEDFQLKLQVKNEEVQSLKDSLASLQTYKEDLKFELDKLSGADTASRKVFNILVQNPEIPKSNTYEYSEPEHHSKAFLKSIQNSFKNQKNYKIGNLITDLRGTKFNSKTPNTLKLVENYAVSPDITRSGYGLVAVEKSHGYAAYIHLTATNYSEAMLAAKAIQNYCSVFKGFRIIPLDAEKL